MEGKNLIRILTATLVGSIIIFLLGYLIFGILLEPYTKVDDVPYPGLRKNPPDFMLLMLKNVVQAFLLVYIFEYLAEIRTFKRGLIVSGIIMFIITVSLNLSLLSIMNLHNSIIPNIFDVIGETVRMAIGGGVIGWILGRMDGGKGR